MRTTLTLDDDIAIKLKKRAQSTGASFKELVNDLLRLALNTRSKAKPIQSFRVKASALKAKRGFNFDNIGDLLEQIESPS